MKQKQSVILAASDGKPFLAATFPFDSSASGKPASRCNGACKDSQGPGASSPALELPYCQEVEFVVRNDSFVCLQFITTDGAKKWTLVASHQQRLT